MDTELIQRIRGKANYFLRDDIKVLVKTFNKNYYFLKLTRVSEDHLFGFNFTGKREGEDAKILLLDVFEIVEYEGAKDE